MEKTSENKSEAKSILSYLYETHAFQVFEDNKPFWYTSGKIGPYYINTHYLYGSKEKAEELLECIDSLLVDKEKLVTEINLMTYANYEKNEIFKDVIDRMVKTLESAVDVQNIDYISGGERRDWFFSIPLARCLKKKHITIFKDGTIIVFDGNNGTIITDNTMEKLNMEKMFNERSNIIHITDLVTEASSFDKYWVPILGNEGGKITKCLSVVDRKQGGAEKLLEHNIKLCSIFQIDVDFFKAAIGEGLINERQYKLLIDYIKNPDVAMGDFLMENPEFLSESLTSTDGKTRARAKLCIEKEIYKVI